MNDPLSLLPNLRSADDLVELLARHHRRGSSAPAPPTARPVEEAVNAIGLGAKELYTRARAHFEQVAPAAEAPASPTATSPAPTQIELRTRAPAGATASCLFHLDNDTPLTAKVTFRPSELRDGEACRWAHVRFSPARLEIAPRGLGQVRVEVDLTHEPVGAELTMDVEVHRKGHLFALVWLTIHVDAP